MIEHLFTVLLLGGLPASLPVVTPPSRNVCPRAGACYRRNNITGAFVATSLGDAYDDTLGCRWRRENTGATLWLSMELMPPCRDGFGSEPLVSTRDKAPLSMY